MKAKPTKQRGKVVMELDRGDEPMLEAANRAFAASPFRLNRILVPVDFSDCSRKALQYALPLAQEHEAALTLLYVGPLPIYASGEYGRVDTAALEAEMRAGAEKELSLLVAEEVDRKVPVTTVIRFGSPRSEILELADSLPADLIVLSTHGRTGLKHVFLGSVAEAVVRHAPCPVLVVREREREFLAK